MDRLEGKVALVTGAGSGIGRASSLRFAAEGAAVMCVDLDEASAQATAATIAEGGGAGAALQVNVTEEEAVRAACEETVRELGGLDVLYNNAGVGRAEWDLTIAVNLSGVYYGLRHGGALMAERGGGAIISTASIAGLVGLVSSRVTEFPPVDGSGAYIAAKHGVVGLTRQFALIYADHGVRVNAIAPGYIRTPMIQEALGKRRAPPASSSRSIPLAGSANPRRSPPPPPSSPATTPPSSPASPCPSTAATPRARNRRPHSRCHPRDASSV